MLDVVKDVVVTLIEQKQIANTGDTETNIAEVRKAIKEIYQELMNTKFIQPDTSK